MPRGTLKVIYSDDKPIYLDPNHEMNCPMVQLQCPDCSHPSLIINLWGLPSEQEIIKLRTDGHVVVLKGCTPPEKHEEAFEYECRSCGYKFGEYED